MNNPTLEQQKSLKVFWYWKINPKKVSSDLKLPLATIEQHYLKFEQEKQNTLNQTKKDLEYIITPEQVEFYAKFYAQRHK